MGKTKEEIIEKWTDKIATTSVSYIELANGHSRLSSQITLLVEEAYKLGFEAFRVKAEEGINKQSDSDYKVLASYKEVLETIKFIKQ